MSEIPLKVFVKHTKEETVHRFRGAFDYDGMHTVLSHLYGSPSKRMVIEYVDDDGDRIRVSSDIEWKECCRLHEEHGGSAALKIYVRKVKSEKDGKRAGEKRSPTKGESGSGSDSDGEAAERPVVPKLEMPTETVAHSAVPSLPPVPEVKPVSPAAAVDCVEEGDRTVLELLSLLFKCDAANELVNPYPTVDFGSCVRRMVNPLRGEVHLDIDRATLRHRAVVTACARMDEHDYVAAEAMLVKAGALFPSDQIIDYNLACVASLQGHADRAVFHLESAVTHGYDRADHLEKDADLQPILGDERVQVLLSRMRGEDRVAAPVTDSAPRASTPEAAATPATPVSPVSPVVVAPLDPNVQSILSIFPHVGEGEVKRVLAAHGNNVHAAVNALLTLV